MLVFGIDALRTNPRIYIRLEIMLPTGLSPLRSAKTLYGTK